MIYLKKYSSWLILLVMLIILQRMVKEYFYVGSRDQSAWISFACLLLALLPAVSGRFRQRIDYLNDLGRRHARFVWSALGFIILMSYLGYIQWIDSTMIGQSGGDQSAYYRMLKALLNGTFKDRDYYYGLGYPSLAFLGHYVYPTNPFVPINALCFSLLVVYTARFVDALTKNIVFAIIASVCFSFEGYFFSLYVTPWTSTVVAPLFLCCSYHFLFSEKQGLGSLLFLGLATGLSFACRYVDIVLFLPFWISVFITAVKSPERHVKLLIIAGALVAGVFLATIFWSHWFFFGSIWETPYRYHPQPAGGSDQTLSHYFDRFGIAILIHNYGTLFDSNAATWDFNSIDIRSRMLPAFARCVMLYFGCIGIYLTIRNRLIESKKLLIFSLGLIAFFVIYGTHPGAYPGCLRYHSTHYYKPLLPLFFVGAIYLFYQWRDIPARILLKWIGVQTVIAVILSLVCAWYTPRIFDAHIEPQSLVRGATYQIQVVVKNRFGQTMGRSGLAEFHPHFEYRKMPQNKGPGRITMTVDPTQGGIWRGSFVAPNDSNYDYLKVFSFSSEELQLR